MGFHLGNGLCDLLPQRIERDGRRDRGTLHGSFAAQRLRVVQPIGKASVSRPFASNET